MSETLTAPIEQDASESGIEPAHRSLWSSALRLAIEFALLFGAAVLLEQFVLPQLNDFYPDPLWLPVIVLTLQHGLTTGLVAAFTAVAIHFYGGLPPAMMGEDIYAYVGRIAAEPIGWICAGLLIGLLRSRQIAEKAELETELAETVREATTVADLCLDLKARADMLERHIAANGQSSHIDIAEAVTGLRDANASNFTGRLTQFITLMTGTAEFAIYLLRDSTLNLAFQPPDENRRAADRFVEGGDSLFTAVVVERRSLLVARPADRLVLANRGSMVGPLVDKSAPERVIGMLAIGGAELVDFPEDIERRFALTCAEIARLLDRVILLETVAPAPVARPVSRLEQLHSNAQRETAKKMNLKSVS